MEKMSGTMLRDLPRGQILRFWRGRRMVFMTTAGEMINEGRISGTLCLDQLAWAFDADRIEMPGYCPPARRDEQLIHTASADRWAVAAQ